MQVQRSFPVSALGSNQLGVQYMDPMQTLALALGMPIMSLICFMWFNEEPRLQLARGTPHTE